MECVALISLSNGLPNKQVEIISNLEKLLTNMNIKVIKSDIIYKDISNSNYSGRDRASELMKLYKDPKIQGIFDVSGGDLANEILQYIDFDTIKDFDKPFFGYSDLSVFINSIYSQVQKKSYLYQIKNIVLDQTNNSFQNFYDYINNISEAFLNFNYKWLQGSNMSGILIGGNLRCTLKLAGTKFMPDFKNKIVLIESLSGDENKIRTMLTHYKYLGVFELCSGVLLGSFTELENILTDSKVENLILSIIDNPNIPVIKTKEIGHSYNSKAVIIGKYYKFIK
ncbi:LD-carboxypeptidase [Clostridium cibarium]|uniref:LD-carboxypeptidase n=1 Tax=Clostridium cibarium TaxID=2762247 RepID=A0ABR8PYW6_9CLOT|nr:LD-carboxypeptidase [Clostridium cibarium]MBD7913327.1 LD-carboxypeptidase [Clostridium cibarium]